MALAGYRLLLVEDDPLIATDLRDELASRGAEVLGPVPSVGAALRMLRSERPDAAVLDVNLRNERSAPVARALRRMAVPFVLATGYSRDQLPEPEYQDAPVVTKPVRTENLVRLLLRMLASRQATPIVVSSRMIDHAPDPLDPE